MNNDLTVILMDIVTLCESISNIASRILVLDVDKLDQNQKDERLKIIKSIELLNQGTKIIWQRIEDASKKPTD